MNIFWRRVEGESEPFSKDIVFVNNKFTNVYRVLDRVSQYLMSNVIGRGRADFAHKHSQKDTCFRILLFKIFNTIETWEFLEQEFGDLCLRTFDVEKFSDALGARMSRGETVFSAAYIMTGSCKKYDGQIRKHDKWLCMLQEYLVDGDLFGDICAARSLEEVVGVLKQLPMVGKFLSYQYAIDLNYSDVIDFDENDFVVAGPGAVRGVNKCFEDLEGGTCEDAIHYMYDNFDNLMQRFGDGEFCNLYGRNPSLIDLQNCFCETDKYLRVAMPELNQGAVKIKQRFRRNITPIAYIFPEQWDLSIL